MKPMSAIQPIGIGAAGGACGRRPGRQEWVLTRHVRRARGRPRRGRGRPHGNEACPPRSNQSHATSNRVSNATTRILKIGDQRLARKTGRLRPKIQKITPQRLRDVSLTLGNVARIFCKPDTYQTKDFGRGMAARILLLVLGRFDAPSDRFPPT